VRKLFAAALAASLTLSSTGQGQEGSSPPSSQAPGRLQLNPKLTAAPAASANQRTADAIAAKLNQDPLLKGFRVTVTVHDGDADLTGSVPTKAQREEVLRVARSVPGVQRVRDRLQLTAGTGVVQAQAAPVPPSPFQPIPVQNGPGLPNGLTDPRGPNPMPPFGPFPPQPGFGGVPPGMVGAPPAYPGAGPGFGGVPPGMVGAPPGYPGTGPGFGGVPPGMVGPPPGYPGAAPGYGGIQPPIPMNGTPPGFPSATQPPPMPPYAWPTTAPYNNFSRVAYPNLYPYESFPFIGPFYPFPRVPLGWRSVTLSWEDGHWWLGRNATGHDWWRVRYW
jgi:BON domain